MFEVSADRPSQTRGTRLLSLIGRREWLDRPSYRLEHLLSLAFNFDDLLVELDIHFRIEDDLYYPALSAASSLIAIAHAEHRQVIDQLSVLLRTSPAAPTYDDE